MPPRHPRVVLLEGFLFLVIPPECAMDKQRHGVYTSTVVWIRADESVDRLIRPTQGESTTDLSGSHLNTVSCLYRQRSTPLT